MGAPNALLAPSEWMGDMVDCGLVAKGGWLNIRWRDHPRFNSRPEPAIKLRFQDQRRDVKRASGTS
jgi:hypothetical protein